jgi:hypothetical protein
LVWLVDWFTEASQKCGASLFYASPHPELQENPAEGVPGQLVFWEKFEMDIRKIQSRFCHHY